MTKPIKLTPTQDRVLRFASVFPVGVDKPMMERFGHRLGTYEALQQRGLLTRPPLGGGMHFTITAEGQRWVQDNPPPAEPAP